MIDLSYSTEVNIRPLYLSPVKSNESIESEFYSSFNSFEDREELYFPPVAAYVHVYAEMDGNFMDLDEFNE